MSLFDKTIQRMEQEVRDLKTSHQIAVGSLTFYKESAQAVGSGWPGLVYLRMTMKNGERAYPYFQIHYSPSDNASEVVGDTYFDFTNDGMILEMLIVVSANRTYNFIATSTSAFDLIAKGYEEGDWIGPNPPE